MTNLNRLIDKRDEYVERLEAGSKAIHKAKEAGKDVRLWDDYLQELSTQHKEVCRKIGELQNDL